MKWQRLILVLIVTMSVVFAGHALAQTDININNANLIRFGGSVTVAEHQVVENALAFGGNVTVAPNAKVVDTAIAFGGNVILQPGAIVEGDAYSFGGNIVQEPGAVIQGERATFSDRHGMMHGTDGGHRSFWAVYFFSAFFKICAAVVAALLGLIVLQTSPRFLPHLATTLRQHTGLTVLWGLGALVTLIFAIVFLAITLIGIPLIPLLSLTAVLTGLVGSLGVALFVGQSLLRQGEPRLPQQFLVGLAILTGLSLLPFFGGFVVFLINLLGLGVILLRQLGRNDPSPLPSQ